ncbi:GrpB family protein [Clostridium sp. 19966]|uniref:GrpB family protein n=1 Tax=Clostridium sp. 19966 TaxID=2768166 RepID=UPI0028DE5EF8|nr:GrpB family protein [Clostridium sp. 19966]
MTLEELWQLFPIILKEHNSDYKVWYEIEKRKLTEGFGKSILRINHIGSTAVEGLIAKPTVDILMEISSDSSIDEVKEKLLSMEWILMNSTISPKFKQTYNKGYTKTGFAEKVYHLHVRYFDDWNELYFRDYLIEYPEVAKEYGELKLELWKKFEHDRDGYTEAKSDFVLSVTDKARKKYGNIYA